MSRITLFAISLSLVLLLGCSVVVDTSDEFIENNSAFSEPQANRHSRTAKFPKDLKGRQPTAGRLRRRYADFAWGTVLQVQVRSCSFLAYVAARRSATYQSDFAGLL